MSDEQIEIYYNRGKEQNRLLNASGQLERVRTQELLMRYLPDPPAQVADIGGGTGIHALWLAEKGYQVHLRDIVPLHIEQALKDSQSQKIKLISAKVGDARDVDLDDASMDVVLLLGPMYHLQERSDRIQALEEAHRLLKSGGLLMVATISKYASLLDGIIRGFSADPHYMDLVESAIEDGRHGHEQLEPQYFTTAFFHHPDEIQAEIEEANFDFKQTLPIEGPAAFIRDFDAVWDDEVQRERLLKITRKIEHDPYILGTSSHSMSIAYKG